MDELQAELLKDYHILVFLGHGAAKDPTKDQETCIYLDGTSPEDLENYPFIRNETEHRGAREVSSGYGVVEAQDLAAALDGKVTRLVFLAACNTAAAGKGGDRLLDSFAQGMASQAPAIVAMQYFIGADNGAKLAEFFLRALAEFRRLIWRWFRRATLSNRQARAPAITSRP
ncbi:CHAT domain-containing protein [Candidatus Amarolinea dominans]|uniref:CHAT domain-containing protein n=1 Tax=Candidatus Amarolinea dominans TaxID=3140696 RepID=UPI001DEE1A89|nr:CHAT domain-containing protein [Anaerolineae bacterium]